MDLELATVVDPTNIQCRVQLFDERAPTDARYDPAMQERGVVIRPCHIVVVDRSRDPRMIVWRLGTVTTVDKIEGEMVTYNDGYRPARTVRCFKDERPEYERREGPITVGDRVFIAGLDELAVRDRVIGGRPAHTERLRGAYVQMCKPLKGTFVAMNRTCKGLWSTNDG